MAVGSLRRYAATNGCERSSPTRSDWIRRTNFKVYRAEYFSTIHRCSPTRGRYRATGRAPVPQRDAAVPVTFLFTDIEGSTQLWESAPEIMSRALQRHDHLLRQAIVEGGGVVFKTVGDAFFAVFDSPLAAVATAVHAQQVLSAEPWPPEANIKVRMALHTGQCEQRDGDFFGPTLNRVARLLAIGHGGQTLATRVVADLVGQQLPSSIVLVDMGEHRLRDLSRPQQVLERLP